MSTKAAKKFTWKDVVDITTARRAIDMGVLLEWSEAKRLSKMTDHETKVSLIQHMSVRLSERWTDRLSTEILIETLLVFLTSVEDEKLFVTFLEELINADEFENIARVFVEVSLSSDVGDDEIDIAMRATAVALICELGFCIQQIEEESPGHLERGKSLLDHIATYLLSVGNTSIQSVRLSLLRYFSHSEYGDSNKSGFTKIMGRFGHTLFDTLFQQLFSKKSEAMALQFLLDNLPTALEAVGDSQVILHETFKQYMLKYPERFSLFMHEMGHRVLSLNPADGTFCPAAESYYKHLVALFKITSDLDHKSLGREILSEMFRLEQTPGCMKYSEVLQSSLQLRRGFRDLVLSHRKELQGKSKGAIVSQFRMSKRGRKPTLSKKSAAGFLEQILLLGQREGNRSA